MLRGTACWRTVGYLDWLDLFAVAAVGNVLGGLGLVTILWLLHVPRTVLAERHDNTNSGWVWVPTMWWEPDEVGAYNVCASEVRESVRRGAKRDLGHTSGR
jgi:hypothetical protein